MWARQWLTAIAVLLTFGACRDGQTPANSATQDAAPPDVAAADRAPGSSSAQPNSEKRHTRPDLPPRNTTPTAPKEPAGWPAIEPPDIERDFCTERMHTLDADACFALPEKRTPALLIYLHGIVPPTKESVQKTNLQQVVANASERAGVVALLPRGKQGFAPQAYPGWWGWPTSKHGFRNQGGEFIEKIREKRQALEKTLGTRFERVFLAGSSSGAYFVVAVALFGAMPEVAGFGVISGGSGYKTEELSALPSKPVYIGFGQHDSVAGGARALGRQLEKLGWPVKLGAHPLPHGAREVYLDEAFAFWAAHE